MFAKHNCPYFSDNNKQTLSSKSSFKIRSTIQESYPGLKKCFFYNSGRRESVGDRDKLLNIVYYGRL